MGDSASSLISGNVHAATEYRSAQEQIIREDWRNYVRANYLDLDRADQKLIADYLLAFNKNKRNLGQGNYTGLKTKVLERIANTYKGFNIYPAGSNNRIKLVATLINLMKAVKDTDIPIAEVKSWVDFRPKQNAKNINKDLISLSKVRSGMVEITPENLPAEINGILMTKKDDTDETYLDYLEKNVNALLFTSQLCKVVKMFSDNSWVGTTDELSRTIIVDTFSEKGKTAIEPWSLAATLVHEAAHIEWFHKQENSPEFQHLGYTEEYAYITECNFLKRILSDPRFTLNAAQRSDITKRIQILTQVLPKNTQ
jgi:hypothetical protein